MKYGGIVEIGNLYDTTPPYHPYRNDSTAFGITHDYLKETILYDMVNRGPSKGCQTCKDRRVKCDLGKPECERCLRLGRACGGYEKKPRVLKFKDQSDVVTQKCLARDRDRFRTVVVVVESPAAARRYHQLRPSDEQLALTFFLNNFAILGRDFLSSRGFFETIPVLLPHEHPGSALSLAITALSLRFWHMWRSGPDGARHGSRAHLNRALSRLQAAINDPTESRSPGTLLAATSLQFDENIAAVMGRSKATRIHHDGALALARHQTFGSEGAKYGRYLVFYNIHIEVSYAMREKRSVPPEIVDAFNQLEALTPKNPSSRLDKLGLSVADLQQRFMQIWSGNALECLTENSTKTSQTLADLCSEAKLVRADLIAWLKHVPDSWQPAQDKQRTTTDPPIMTYHGIYEVYPTVQIAAMWNIWRCYHLVLLKIIIAASLHRSDATTPRDGAGILDEHQTVSLTEEYSTVQQVVDAICYSIPFYLGNCYKPLSMDYMTDTTIWFPSYHTVDPDGAERKRHISISQEDHVQHVISQGAWQVLTPLVNLVNHFSGPDAWLMAPGARPGQFEWVRGQLVRATILMHLSPFRDACGDAGAGADSEEQFLRQNSPESDTSEVETLTKVIQESMRVTSGP